MAAKTKPKAKSRVLAAVHETAADLHRLGLIDIRNSQNQTVQPAGAQRTGSGTLRRGDMPSRA